MKAGLSLFLERGIEGVTIDEIVARASVAKGSFYLYFRDKADLVQATFSPLRERIEEAFQTFDNALKEARTPEALYHAYQLVGRLLGAAFFQETQVTRLYLQESRGPGIGARKPVRELADLISQKSIEFTRVALDQGLLRPFDPRISALTVVGAVERLLFGHLAGEDLGGTLEAAESLISLVMDGLRPPAKK